MKTIYRIVPYSRIKPDYYGTWKPDPAVAERLPEIFFISRASARAAIFSFIQSQFEEVSPDTSNFYSDEYLYQKRVWRHFGFEKKIEIHEEVATDYQYQNLLTAIEGQPVIEGVSL